MAQRFYNTVKGKINAKQKYVISSYNLIIDYSELTGKLIFNDLDIVPVTRIALPTFSNMSRVVSNR